MLILAFCQDSPQARTQRPRYLAPHMQHLRDRIQSICLAAPLATADGAAIADDDRLVASIFAIEAPTFESARELMRADPYARDDVWGCVSLFTVHDAYGQWISPGIPARTSQRTYVLFFAPESAADAAATRGLAEAALFGAQLRFTELIGNPALARHWQSVIVLGATSLEEAHSRVARQPGLQAGGTRVWAIPLAVGRWPGKTQL